MDYIFDKEPSIHELIEISKERDKALGDVTLEFSLASRCIDLEAKYREDIDTSTGFKLDHTFSYGPETRDMMDLLEGDSIYSYKFGVRSSDPEAILQKRCRCECGHTTSLSMNVFCVECNTFTDTRPYQRGWLILENDYKIFNPFYLNILIEALIPAVRGKTPAANSKLRKEDRVPMFKDTLYYIDKITGFRYDMHSLTDKEVLLEFIDKYTKPDARREHLLDKINIATTRAIPVCSKNFRHHIQSKSFGDIVEVETHKMNIEYQNISHSVKRLNDNLSMPAKKIRDELTAINKKFRNVLELIYDTCFKDKEADVRDKIYGRRTKNSGRSLLESTQLLSGSQCTIGYAMFGVMFIDEMYDYLIKLGMSPKMERQIRLGKPGPSARVLLNKVLDILKKTYNNYILAKRSPVIYLSSIQAFELVALTKENIIRCSPFAIAKFKGDKDGDILAIFVLPPAIRLGVFLALSTRMTSIDRKTIEFVDYDLVDASYIMTYKMLDDGCTREDIFAR